MHSPAEKAAAQNRPQIPRPALTPSHILHRLMQRSRVLLLRLRYPQLKAGAGFNLSGGLELRLSPGARIEFGERCVVDRFMTIQCEGVLNVGDRTVFGHHCTVASCECVEIGADCLIAEMVSIRDHDHRFDRLDAPILEQGAEIAPVRIGRNVWLGAKVTVVKGVSIGDNVIVGANSVVTHDIPANAIAVGAPARIIRYRENGTISSTLQS